MMQAELCLLAVFVPGVLAGGLLLAMQFGVVVSALAFAAGIFSGACLVSRWAADYDLTLTGRASWPLKVDRHGMYESV